MNVKLNGKDYLIRYPLAACRALEKELDKSVFQIFDEAASGAVSMNLIVGLLWAGILHANRAVTMDMVSMWLDGEANLMEIYRGCFPEFQEAVVSKLRVPSEEAERDDAEKN